MGYYLTIKRNEVLINPTKWMNLENTGLREKPDTEYHILYDSRVYKMSKIGKSIKTEDRSVLAQDWQMGTSCISRHIIYK